MPPRRTLLQLESDLDQILTQYRKQGIDLVIIKQSFKDWKNATNFLRRNRGNPRHPQIEYYTNLIESTKDDAAKYNKIANLEKRITKKRREENQRDTTNQNDTNGQTSGNQHESINDILIDPIDRASLDIVLSIIDIFPNVNDDQNNEVDDLSFDHLMYGTLRMILRQANINNVQLAAMQKLDEIEVLSVENDGVSFYTFWQFYLMREKLQSCNNIQYSSLLRHLLLESCRYLKEFIDKCFESDVIINCTQRNLRTLKIRVQQVHFLKR